MTKKIFVRLLFTIVLGLSAVACERSASSPVVTPTNPELNFPVNTAPVIEDIVHMTQTALAGTGAGGSVVTPVPLQQATKAATQPAQSHEAETATQPVPTATSTSSTKRTCVSSVYKGAYVGEISFGICAVAKDQSVTIQTNYFPANKNYTVRMAVMGNKAAGGTQVGSGNSGKGGTFQATFNTPSSLKGVQQIAIRVEWSGYATWNWFYNNASVP